MPTYDTPRYIPNCKVWLDAGAGLTVSGSNVTAWADQSGNNNHPTIVGTPTRVLAALNGLPAVAIPQSSTTVRLPAATSAMALGITCFFVWRSMISNANMSNSSGGLLWITQQSGAPQTYSGVATNPAQISNGTSFNVTIASYGTANPAADPWTPNYFSIDGSAAATSALASGIPAGNTLDVGYLNFANIQVCEVVVYDRILTRPEMYEVNRYLAAKYNLWWPLADATATPVLFQGNSTTMSYYLSNRFATANTSLRVIGDSFAYSGGGAQTIWSQRRAMMEWCNYMRARGFTPLLVVHTGHNDGDTPNIDLFQSVDGPIQQWRRAGGKVMIHTQTPWNGSSGNTTEATRGPLNTWIRANWQTYADGMYDLGATAQFGIWDNGTPTAGTSRGDYPTLWYDAVHPTVAGQDAKVVLIGPSLRALAGKLTLTSNTSSGVAMQYAQASAGTTLPTGWSIQIYRYAGTYDSQSTATRGAAVSGMTTTTPTDLPYSASNTGGFQPDTTYSYMAYLSHATEGWAWVGPLVVQTKRAGGSSPGRIFGGL